MKKIALTVIAASMTIGSIAAPAFAADGDNIQTDSQIVSISAGNVTLANGETVKGNYLGNTASVGDKVRVTFDGDNHMVRSVRVLR